MYCPGCSGGDGGIRAGRERNARPAGPAENAGPPSVRIPGAVLPNRKPRPMDGVFYLAKDCYFDKNEVIVRFRNIPYCYSESYLT